MATNKDISILQGSTFSLPVRWMNGYLEAATKVLLE